MKETLDIPLGTKWATEEAYKKLQEKYTHPVDGVLKEEDFEEKYNKDEIIRDKLRVNNKKKEFTKKVINDPDLLSLQEKNKKLEILNYTIFEMVKAAKLFGDNVNAKKTTDTDSFFNGIDVVLEANKKVENNSNKEISKSRLGLAMDIMSVGSKDGFSAAVTQKYGVIKKHIESGDLGSLKYFKSEDHNSDELLGLPEVMINISPKEVDELIDLWVNNDYQTLSKHEVKIMIIHQITTQLEAQENYARSEKVNQPNVANVIKESLNSWKEIQKGLDVEFLDRAKYFSKEKDIETTKLYELILEKSFY